MPPDPPEPTPPAPPATPPPATPPAGPSQFAQAMGDELYALPSIKKFEENENPLQAMGKSYVEIQNLLGKDKVVLPGNGAPPEEWDQVWEKLGRPKEPNGYDFSKLKPPEELPWSNDLALSMISSMHRAGLNQQQIETVLGDYIKAQGSDYQGFCDRAVQAKAQTIEKLRQEWGNNYEGNCAIAEQGFRAVAGERADDIGEMLLGDGTKFGNHPLFAALFYNIGKMLGEHELLGDKAPGRLGKTQGEATEELARIYGSEENQKILKNQEHPEHDALMQKISALDKIAHP